MYYLQGSALPLSSALLLVTLLGGGNYVIASMHGASYIQQGTVPTPAATTPQALTAPVTEEAPPRQSAPQATPANSPAATTLKIPSTTKVPTSTLPRKAVIRPSDDARVTPATAPRPITSEANDD